MVNTPVMRIKIMMAKAVQSKRAIGFFFNISYVFLYNLACRRGCCASAVSPMFDKYSHGDLRFFYRGKGDKPCMVVKAVRLAPGPPSNDLCSPCLAGDIYKWAPGGGSCTPRIIDHAVHRIPDDI